MLKSFIPGVSQVRAREDEIMTGSASLIFNVPVEAPKGELGIYVVRDDNLFP